MKQGTPFVMLFKWATVFDYILIFAGITCGILAGLGIPMVNLFIGSIITTISDHVVSKSDSDLVFWSKVTHLLFHLVLLGVSIFITAYLMMAILGWTSARQCRRWRSVFFTSILQKEIAFFDEITPAELLSRANTDFASIEGAISDKLGLIALYISIFISGFAIAFYRCWQLALIISVILPVMGVSGSVFTSFISRFTERAQKRYNNANRLATETLMGIRTIAALRAESTQISAYKEEVERAAAQNTKGHLFSAASLSFIWMSIFFAYALAFYAGARLISSEVIIERGVVVSVFFSIVVAAFSIGHAFPHIATVAKGATAAASLYMLLNPDKDNSSSVDPTKLDVSESSLLNSSAFESAATKPLILKEHKPECMTGVEDIRNLISTRGIVFQNVCFKYKGRSNTSALQSISFILEPGKTTAIVGRSGAGKSTIVQLIQRFYEPTSGAISIGTETPFPSIPVSLLRTAIGVVSQEAILFDDTIFNNVALGLLASQSSVPFDISKQEEIRERVIAACRLANAHTFIIGFPEGYETRIGPHFSSKLSGGQRQRIAIARAIVGDPALLILDEATAALDVSSEAAVQDALATASRGRTTLVIAHRLSTIQSADHIIVMDNGNIVEQGNHSQLMAAETSLYATLIQAQTIPIQTMQGDTPMTESLVEQMQTPPCVSSDIAYPADIQPAPSMGLLKNDKVDVAAKLPLYRVILRVLQLQRPEMHHLVFGLICAMGNGVGMPFLAFIFGNIQTTFAKSSIETLPYNVRWLILLLIFQGLFNFCCQFGQMGLFGIAGERLTSRLRVRSFTAMLARPISSFDNLNHKENGTALATRLTTDPDSLKNFTGPLFGTILQTATTMSLALIIAFTTSPLFASILLVTCMPLMILCGYLQMKILTRTGLLLRDHLTSAQSIFFEALAIRRTVAALNAENWFIQRYKTALDSPFRLMLSRSLIANGLSFGFSQAMFAWSYAIAFYYGTKLLLRGQIDYETMNNVLYLMVFSAMSVGQIFSFLPNISEASLAARTIFSLLDEYTLSTSSLSDSHSKDNVDLNQMPTKTIEFKNVCFSYPSRPTVRVIDNLSLSLEIGKRIAIVGPSGSGKSSLFGLLERFYEPQSGSIMIDGKDINTFPLDALRSIFGLVLQDPILFSRSIAENIILGCCGGFEKMKHTEAVEDAALMAGIHHEILTSFPNGYQTQVGEYGSMLSGGQRQRIAIARAIIGNPRVLLLDEATSALDSHAELKLQKAIRDFSSASTSLAPKTVIVIAHRLSTIRDFDQIIVMDKGRVVESGTHNQLMGHKDGLYASLVQCQER